MCVTVQSHKQQCLMCSSWPTTSVFVCILSKGPCCLTCFNCVRLCRSVFISAFVCVRVCSVLLCRFWACWQLHCSLSTTKTALCVSEEKLKERCPESRKKPGLCACLCVCIRISVCVYLCVCVFMWLVSWVVIMKTGLEKALLLLLSLSTNHLLQTLERCP